MGLRDDTSEAVVASQETGFLGDSGRPGVRESVAVRPEVAGDPGSSASVFSGLMSRIAGPTDRFLPAVVVGDPELTRRGRLIPVQDEDR
jgi:hypothetical protein